MLHILFYFCYSKQSTHSSHTSSKESKESSIFTPIVVEVLISVLGLFVSGDIIYAFLRNKYNERLLNNTVERGTRPQVNINKFVSRPKIMKRLKEIFQPNEEQSSYYVVSGEHGTGKTTLIKIASNEVGQDDEGKHGGMGVIYVNVPADIENFSEEFAKAINFSFEKCVSFTGQLKRKIVGHTGQLIFTVYC